jgi:hypothetical protein
MRMKVFVSKDKDLIKRQTDYFITHHPELNILNIIKDLTYAKKLTEQKEYRYIIYYVKKENKDHL